MCVKSTSLAIDGGDKGFYMAGISVSIMCTETVIQYKNLYGKQNPTGSHIVKV